VEGRCFVDDWSALIGWCGRWRHKNLL